MNNSTIISKSDSDSKNRALRQRLKARLYKVEDNVIYYTVTSGDGSKQYLVKILLLDLIGNKLKSLKSALSGDIKISCNCYAFLYHGLKYIAYHSNSGIDKETRPPNKTNPERKGLACKHIIAALNQMKLDYKEIYNKLKELQPDKDNRATPLDNKDSDSFTDLDVHIIDSFRDACLKLYDEYNKYLNSNPSSDDLFVNSKYYSNVNPILMLGGLSKPCAKEFSKSFIGSRLKTFDDILNVIDQKRNGFTVLLKSDVDKLVKKINSSIHSDNEAFINNVILSLLDYS